LNLLPRESDAIGTGTLLRKSTYADILQRLVRRYLFKQDRLRGDRIDAGRPSRLHHCTHSDLGALNADGVFRYYSEKVIVIIIMHLR